MIVARPGLGAWYDIFLPNSITGANDVVYTDISELTVLPPDELDPETRARLQRVVDDGQARQRARETRNAGLTSLLFLGVAAFGVASLVNATRSSR